jgi:hypothetical protein
MSAKELTIPLPSFSIAEPAFEGMTASLLCLCTAAAAFNVSAYPWNSGLQEGKKKFRESGH